MDLIVFDLDGTLLNNSSEISVYTKETLELLSEKNIAYTVATGRSMHSAQNIIHGHGFDLPHIYSNGVTIWNPQSLELNLENLLEKGEAEQIIKVALEHQITPFVTVINNDNTNYIYHPPLFNDAEKRLLELFHSRSEATILPIENMPQNSQITNISMLGDGVIINKIENNLVKNENITAYSGPALEGEGMRWIDLHHMLANKGGAVSIIKNQLGAQNIICFGDNDNDLSMFEIANESYAPANARDEIKAAVTSVIGHHQEDGIAHFLRERFSL